MDDNGKVTGWEPPGGADPQDHLRQVIRNEVDPLPPFASVMHTLEDGPVVAVHVTESSDTPHLVRATGSVFVREPGGKRRVTDRAELMELARRGREAEKQARDRLYGLRDVEEAMRAPKHLPGDGQWGDEALQPIVELIVRASPITLPPGFADASLSQESAEALSEAAADLLPRRATGGAPDTAVRLGAYARAIYALANRMIPPGYADAVIDSAGVVAARIPYRQERQGLTVVQEEDLTLLARAASRVLEARGALGRAVVGLEIRGADGLTVPWRGSSGGIKLDDDEEEDTLYVGSEMRLPADDEEIDQTVGRWHRELARAAGFQAWETVS